MQLHSLPTTTVGMGSVHKRALSAQASKTTCDLFYSASDGNTEHVKELLQSGLDVNARDYDQRTALHNAAIEGGLEVCKVLVMEGADVNAVSNTGDTPLQYALDRHHVQVIKFLRENGGTATKFTTAMLTAASQGDLDDLTVLIASGADVNAGDYDQRTPLHLAAAEGQIQTVELLIHEGANVNAIDRFGYSPIQDAYSGFSRGHRAAAQVLLEFGAIRKSATKSSVVGANTIFLSMPLICQLGDFAAAEAFIPSSNEVLFNQAGCHFMTVTETTKTLEEQSKNRSLAFLEGTKIQEVYTTQTAMRLSAEELVTELNWDMEGTVNGAVLVPFQIDGTDMKGIMAMYTSDTENGEGASLEYLTTYCSRVVAAGFYGSKRAVPFTESPGVSAAGQQAVYSEVVRQGAFDSNTIYDELEKFYQLGLPEFYFKHFSAEILGHHLSAYIASKNFAAGVSSPDKIWLHIENNPMFMGRADKEQALLMVSNDHNPIRGAEKNLERCIQRISADVGFSVEFFVSQKNIPGGSKKLGIYVLETNQYAKPGQVSDEETNVWDIAPETFHKTKPAAARKRYQEIINMAAKNLAPVHKIYEASADGTVNVMMAYSTDAASAERKHHCDLQQMTELIHRGGLELKRKFVQSFANGTIVYSMYFDKPNQKDLTTLVDNFTMLHTLPTSKLTHYFVAGKMSAQLYNYASCAGRFVYYFINQRSGEYDALERDLQDDPLNLSRLRLMHSSLKREAVGMRRIWQSVLGHEQVMIALANDFNEKLDGKEPSVEDLDHLIHTNAYSPLDEQVLRGFVTFNRAVRKSNINAPHKASVAFRMDPTELPGDWPDTPYGIFFLVGVDFQGFHVRFADVARGGIRMIRSRDAAHYTQNLATLFAENYGLAYTQNKKNKDIPEFGSKGTILLAKHSQGNAFSAFKKYISGLLDMMMPSESMYDVLGEKELLFLGPDEGTADMMEWAARHAKERGYEYWKSFTTGKPPSLGGIPHDAYGMTTRSVHRYAVGVIEKLGLDETQVTKFMTGGPDGDLGSNEILLSCDKTTSIVDGSGTLHDPEGLNRVELTRLATERLMIEHFDASKLGPKGFKLLCAEQDVTLPDGTVVADGLTFRNNFHLHPLSSADLFVPCGGRPEAVNVQNVKALFNDDGTCRFKYIIEGANLFFTNDARMMLEENGVVLYKDASTNKGGVTSSSLEVLAALSMTDREFDQHMAVKEGAAPPQFYADYVQEIQDRVEADATLEFECIWQEHARTGEARFVLTERVSDKINNLNMFVQNSNLWTNIKVRNAVMIKAIPKRLTDQLGLDVVLERVPENYTKAIFAAYLASRYVYQYGVNAHEFAFFEFMQNLTSDVIEETE